MTVEQMVRDLLDTAVNEGALLPNCFRANKLRAQYLSAGDLTATANLAEQAPCRSRGRT